MAKSDEQIVEEFDKAVNIRRKELEECLPLVSSVPGAGYIPTEDDPERTGGVLTNFFAGTPA
jgi:hypothetical protein